MLYFSDTVCVLTSSSLPAREGALESSKGLYWPPLCRLRPLPEISELQLVRLEDMPEGDRETGSGESRYGRGPRPWAGGSNISADSATPPGALYSPGDGFEMLRPDWPVVGRCGGMSCLAVCGVLVDMEPSDPRPFRSPAPAESTVMCGGRRGPLSSFNDILADRSSNGMRR